MLSIALCLDADLVCEAAAIAGRRAERVPPPRLVGSGLGSTRYSGFHDSLRDEHIGGQVACLAVQQGLTLGLEGVKVFVPTSLS